VTCSIRTVNTKTGVEKTICLRGAFLTDNKTSQCEAEGVRDRVFGYGRGLLQGWKAKFVSMFGSEEPCTIPDPTSYRLARFRDGSSVMSDGCNQARKMQEKMKEMIVVDYVTTLGGTEEDKFAAGQAKWDTMSETERNESVRVYIITCQNHLRSTSIRHGIKFEKEFLKEMLSECLADFDASFRLTFDTEAICRAAAKEFMFSGGRLYAKGKGSLFLAWVIDKYPDRVVYILHRADLGTRLDSTTEVALALYMNRELYLEFLFERMQAATSAEENKLEKALFVLLSSTEVIAAIRVRAMIHLKITMPMRFLTNSNDVNYSPADMGPLVDALDKFLLSVESNGNLLMDTNVDIFHAVTLPGTRTHDFYAAFQKDFLDRIGRSIDGTVELTPYEFLCINNLTPLRLKPYQLCASLRMRSSRPVTPRTRPPRVCASSSARSGPRACVRVFTQRPRRSICRPRTACTRPEMSRRSCVRTWPLQTPSTTCPSVLSLFSPTTRSCTATSAIPPHPQWHRAR